MSEASVRSAKTQEFLTRERCHITERLNDPQNGRFSLADARVEPGVVTELHKLAVDEWYVVRQGTGRIEVGGKPWIDVAPGDYATIPAGVSQRIENTGAEDLIFHCICMPRFTPDCYEALENA